MPVLLSIISERADEGDEIVGGCVDHRLPCARGHMQVPGLLLQCRRHQGGDDCPCPLPAVRPLHRKLEAISQQVPLTFVRVQPLFPLEVRFNSLPSVVGGQTVVEGHKVPHCADRAFVHDRSLVRRRVVKARRRDSVRDEVAHAVQAGDRQHDALVKLMRPAKVGRHGPGREVRRRHACVAILTGGLPLPHHDSLYRVEVVVERLRIRASGLADRHPILASLVVLVALGPAAGPIGAPLAAATLVAASATGRSAGALPPPNGRRRREISRPTDARRECRRSGGAGKRGLRAGRT
mmetsp:Transcript_42852/g.124602  ORF Transcript_42852/g.124602 Transcript_42852/m.124602 type:complete len:294 (-) Transcript_42852:74-955(-)